MVQLEIVLVSLVELVIGSRLTVKPPYSITELLMVVSDPSSTPAVHPSVSAVVV